VVEDGGSGGGGGASPCRDPAHRSTKETDLGGKKLSASPGHM